MTIYPITLDDADRRVVTIPLYMLLEACQGRLIVREIPGGIIVDAKTEDEDEDEIDVDDMIRAFSGG